MNNTKVALVYDRVNKFGGAERVLLALHEIWPDAPLFTSVYDPALAKWANVFDVRTSFLQKLPLPKNKHEYYPFLMGIAFESFNFDEFDVVISVTHEFAKAIITKPKTLHICYCLSPVSYLWSGYDDYFQNKFLKAISKPLISYLRWYDKIICRRPDKYIAISKTVQDRIKKYYDQESEIIYPPVSITSRTQSPASPADRLEPSNYFLIVSRLVPQKRIDIAIEAFNRLKLPLKIVGTGVEEKRLKAMAKDNTEFLGNLTDREVTNYYKSAKAVIICGEEDFNIVAVEAQSFGKPVIAYGAGGVTETVIAGKTGVFFNPQTRVALEETIDKFRNQKFNEYDCKTNARQFSKTRFHEEFGRMVEKTQNSKKTS